MGAAVRRALCGSAVVCRLSLGVSVGRAPGKVVTPLQRGVSSQQSHRLLPGSDPRQCQAGRAAGAACCRQVVRLALLFVQRVD